MTEFNDSPYLSYFQSIKVKKFESNSQLQVPPPAGQGGYFQSIKVKKFESNSQRVDEVTSMEKGCFHSVKVIKI